MIGWAIAFAILSLPTILGIRFVMILRKHDPPASFIRFIAFLMFAPVFGICLMLFYIGHKNMREFVIRKEEMSQPLRLAFFEFFEIEP